MKTLGSIDPKDLNDILQHIVDHASSSRKRKNTFKLPKTISGLKSFIKEQLRMCEREAVAIGRADWESYMPPIYREAKNALKKLESKRCPRCGKFKTTQRYPGIFTMSF